MSEMTVYVAQHIFEPDDDTMEVRYVGLKVFRSLESAQRACQEHLAAKCAENGVEPAVRLVWRDEGIWGPTVGFGTYMLQKLELEEM